MLVSPPPAQQQPDRDVEPAQKKPVRTTRIRRRTGETPAALLIKAILRPLFKGIYYLLRAIRYHKLVTVLLLLLLIVSSSVATYFATASWPFGIGSDPFHGFNGLQKNGDAGDHVKNWLYALRDGDVTTMQLIEGELIMTQPPDPSQLVTQFSEKNTHLVWKAINITNSYTESDTTVDTLVEVDMAAPGPGGAVKAILLLHFTTLPQQQGRILLIHIVDFRQPLQ